MATPADDDFARRCNSPGVVRYFTFDSQSVTAPYLDPGDANPVIDTTIKASGKGSLKMTIPSNSPANTSGDFSMNFTPGSPNYSSTNAYPIQFGEGDEFYVQWRQRFSPEFLSTNYTGSDGWKQAIVGEGDRLNVAAYSCTELELVVENLYQRGFAQMYHSCNLWESLQVPYGTSDWKLQNAIPSPYCLYSSHPCPPCAGYQPNQWMTFQMHVKIGTWYLNDGNYHHNSTVELWVAQENQPSELAISRTDFDLVNTNPSAKYGKIWLLPYNTNKDASQTTPVAYTWYDELIVSKSRIPDPSLPTSTLQSGIQKASSQGFTLHADGKTAFDVSFTDAKPRTVEVFTIGGKLLAHKVAVNKATIHLTKSALTGGNLVLSIDGDKHLISCSPAAGKVMVVDK